MDEARKEALLLLAYALNLRIHGEEPLVGTWRDWESRTEAYLRSVSPDGRSFYEPYNETTSMKGNIMDQAQNDTTPAPVQETAKTKKKAAKWAVSGIFLFASILVIDDYVKKVTRRGEEKVEETPDQNATSN